MLEISKQSKVLWPTHTMSLQIKNAGELNRGLAQVILGKESEIKSRKGTPVAGLTAGLTTHWLEYNVFKWAHPAIYEFRSIVLDGLREYFSLFGDPDETGLEIAGLSCWANVLRYGESLAVHHHDPAFVSAHYQVQGDRDSEPNESVQEDTKEAGNTVYFRPGFLDRSHGGKAAGPASLWDEDWRISVPPVSGNLFFFPSYVRHEVRPILGKGQRISIAMDVFIKRQESPIYFGGPRWFVPEQRSVTKQATT